MNNSYSLFCQVSIHDICNHLCLFACKMTLWLNKITMWLARHNSGEVKIFVLQNLSHCWRLHLVIPSLLPLTLEGLETFSKSCNRQGADSVFIAWGMLICIDSLLQEEENIDLLKTSSQWLVKASLQVLTKGSGDKSLAIQAGQLEWALVTQNGRTKLSLESCPRSPPPVQCYICMCLHTH